MIIIDNDMLWWRFGAAIDMLREADPRLPG